nr:hypothetical protein FVER53263_00314 [Fusarium verticillioides]
MSKLPSATRTLVAPKKCLPAEYTVIEQPIPKITKPNQLLLRMKAVAINTGETGFAAGQFDLLYKASFPILFGIEGSGVVVEIGSEITEFKVGDAVYGMEFEKPHLSRPPAAWASTYALTEPQFLHKKPDHVSFEEAAAVPALAVTAYQGIKRGLQLQGRDSLAGQTVYIPAALSASGNTAIQIARNYFGAEKIISTVSTPKMGLVEEYLPGMVTQLYDYKTQDIVQLIGRGTVDFAISTQFSTLNESISVLKTDGILMSIASIPKSEVMSEMLGPKFPTWLGWVLDFLQIWYTWKLRGTRIQYEFISGHPGLRGDMEVVADMVAKGMVKAVHTAVDMDDLEEVRKGCEKTLKSKGGIGKLAQIRDTSHDLDDVVARVSRVSVVKSGVMAQTLAINAKSDSRQDEMSQWQNWFVSDLPLGSDVQLTGTSDESLTDWLDPQLVNPADTAAIMQTLSGEDLFKSSGPSYGMSEPPSRDSDPGFNTARNEQIAGFIQKLRSQRPFVLRDENPEAPPGNIRGFYDAKFISQCFDGTVRVLLERKSMDLIADEITKYALAVDTETSVLFHSLMAIGCHSLNLDQGHRAIGKGKYPASKFFKEALNARQHLRDSPSLGGLQAILTMVIPSPDIYLLASKFLHAHKAYFSARVGDDSTSSFLADAAFCVQTLQLHNAGAIEQKYNSFLEQQVAKRALWFLYSLEKPRCLAQGLLPLIHDDFVDYDPPPSANYSTSEVDWFAINARFARICSSIIKERLGCKLGRTPSRRGKDRASEYSASSVIKRLESLLEEWRDDLPFAGDFDATRSDEFAASTCAERRHRIKCLNKYWSAIIATHSGQARGVAEDGGAGVRLSRARCIDAAQAILQNSHYVTSTDILSDISLYYYITVATRVIMTVVIRDRFASDITGDPVQKNTATRKRETTHGRSIMSYVGIAIGLFSRLSLDIDVPVDEVTELGKLGR